MNPFPVTSISQPSRRIQNDSFNQELEIPLRTRSFCDDSFHALSTPYHATISWALSIVQLAEFSLGNQIRLSVKQLLQCLPS